MSTEYYARCPVKRILCPSCGETAHTEYVDILMGRQSAGWKFVVYGYTSDALADFCEMYSEVPFTSKLRPSPIEGLADWIWWVRQVGVEIFSSVSPSFSYPTDQFINIVTRTKKGFVDISASRMKDFREDNDAFPHVRATDMGTVSYSGIWVPNNAVDKMGYANHCVVMHDQVKVR